MNRTRTLILIHFMVATIIGISLPGSEARGERKGMRYQQPGLYYQSKQLPKTDFEFKRREMVGLKINHYADGEYSVKSVPNPLKPSSSFSFYLVPNRPITFGGADEWEGTVFEVKRAYYVYSVQDEGAFLTVKNGHKEGQGVDYKVTPIADKIKTAHEGLVQQRIQVLKIDINLPKGKYVLFEGEGNVFDKESYPVKEQGCWYVEVK